MNSKGIFFLLLCLVLAQSIPANAMDFDDTGWFAGGYLGYLSNASSTRDVESFGADAESYGGYGGYNFTEWFGLEGSLMMTGDTSDGSLSDSDDVHADYLAASFTPRFTLHLGPMFSIYAKAGLARINYDMEFDYVSYENDLDLSWSGFATSYGVGGQFAVVDGIRIRIGYDVLSGTLTDDELWLSMDDLDVKLEQVSFSMHYQF